MIVLHILYHPHNPDTLLITGEDCNGDLLLSIQGGRDKHTSSHTALADVTSLIELITRIDHGIVA